MALAQHVPTGNASAHIKQSRGGEKDLLSFYCTTNQVAYGQPLAKFTPLTTQWEHHKSGFTSNTRAFLPYTPSLDDIDNPRLKPLLAHNYLTMTKKDFTGYERPDGRERFPEVVGSRFSGFTQEDSNKMAIPKDYASRVFFDTRIKSSPADIGERQTPLLHKLRPKDPIALENFGHVSLNIINLCVSEIDELFPFQGPVSQVSEYKVKYRGGEGEKKGKFAVHCLSALSLSVLYAKNDENYIFFRSVPD